MNDRKMAIRALPVFLVAAIFLLAFISCVPVEPAPLEVHTREDGSFSILSLDEMIEINGVITHNRGGPGISDAIVSYPASIFEEPGDIIVSKEGFATGRIQGLLPQEMAGYIFELPIRNMFNPNWSAVPPNIEISGVEPGKTVSGDLDIEISVHSENDIFVFYVYLGGNQRSPVEGRTFLDTNEASLLIDTKTRQNGPTFLRVLAYDYNENSALYVIPLVVDNDVIEDTPPPAVPIINAFSVTFGSNFGFYSTSISERDRSLLLDSLADLSAILDVPQTEHNNPNVTIYNRVIWAPVVGAIGYSIYRSFDGDTFDHLGDVVRSIDGSWRLDDYGSALAIGKKTYYKIIPYNSFGHSEEEPVVRSVTPIPGFNVYLESPKDGETEVPLDPTFQWSIESVDGDFDDYSTAFGEVELLFDLFIHDAASASFYEIEVIDSLQFAFPPLLEPGKVYSWDIEYADAFIIQEYVATGYSFALSMAGDAGGSLNGENIFTTVPASN